MLVHDLRLLDHVLVAVLAAVGIYGIRAQGRVRGAVFDTRTKIALYWSNGMLLALGALASIAVWLMAGRPLADLGLTWRHAAPAVGLGLAAAFAVWFGVETWLELATPKRRAALLARWGRDAPFLPATARELTHFTVLTLAAGFGEEIMARGFLIFYVGQFTGPSLPGVAAAIVLPAVVFALLHRYQGWRAMVRIAVLATMFGAIYVVTGSLVIPIALHVAVDLLGGGLAERLQTRAARPGAYRPGGPPHRPA
jgi:membrane protease YdiL (CAAX protease family)